MKGERFFRHLLLPHRSNSYGLPHQTFHRHEEDVALEVELSDTLITVTMEMFSATSQLESCGGSNGSQPSKP
jgi:hypothetical protein